MKVIWVYEDFEKLPLSRLEVTMLLTSTKLWGFYHPEDTRVLYCNLKLGNTLKSLGVLKSFDKVIILPSNEDFSVDTRIFWSFSKLKTLLIQEEPIILMDHDFIPLCRIKDSLDLDRVCYCNTEYATGYYPGNIDSYVKQLSWKTRWPEYSANVGFLYLPDPEFTRYYAGTSVQVMEEFTNLKVPNSLYLIFAEQMVLKQLLQDQPQQVLLRDVWRCKEHRWDSKNVDQNGIWTLEEASKVRFHHYGPSKKHLVGDDYGRELNWLFELLQPSEELREKIIKIRK